MPVPRRRFALALVMAALTVGVAASIPSARAQDPRNNNQGAGKARAGAARKKPARRRPVGNNAVGAIVPYPLSSSLIIRHTPEAHDEIRALLNLLRYN